MQRQLRPYQTDLVAAIKDTVRSGVRRMVVRLPTGAGKTLVAANLAAGALAKGNGMAFTCPRIDLVDQTVDEFASEGITDIGVLQASHPLTNYSAAVQICSIDTLGSRGYYPDVPLVVFDEVHILKKFHIEYMKQRPDAIYVGLSATPWRYGLKKHFETLIVGATMKGLMADKYLCRYQIFAPSLPDLKGVKKIAGDYSEGSLSRRMRDQVQITADVVQTWLSHGVKDRTLVYAVDRAHAGQLLERFNDAGIPMQYQDGYTEGWQRRELKKAFQNREIPGIVSVETMIIGNDLDVRCISCVRPTMSNMFWVQLFGRGLRNNPPWADKKERLLFLDHSGNSLALGYPEDIEEKYEDLLDEKDLAPQKVQKPEALPKLCPKCNFVKPPKIRMCPSCGFEPKFESILVEKEGKLVDITRGEDGYPIGVPVEVWQPLERLRFYNELRAICLEKGRKSGWAAQAYKKKFGDFPPFAWERNSAPAEKAGIQVRQYVRYLDIQWATSRRKKNA